MRSEMESSPVVEELARALVARFSPAEDDEVFTLLSEAHFADPTRYARADRRIGPLAFGLPELLVLLTPVALVAMTEVVRYLAEVSARKGHQLTAAAVRRLFNGWKAGRPEPAGQVVAGPTAEPLELSRQEWAEIHRIVVRVCQRGGVDPERAALIADAVVGQGQLGDRPGRAVDKPDPPDPPGDERG